eukprot:COSAG01_NODE_692_length_14213_cov_3.971518_5_plen_198_part_00
MSDGNEDDRPGKKKKKKKDGKKKKKKNKQEVEPEPEPEEDFVLEQDFDMADMDDLTKAVVFKNPLLGKSDIWGESRLENVDIMAVDDGELDTGEGMIRGASGEAGQDDLDPDGTYVLNPLAGLTGDAGHNPWIYVADELAMKPIEADTLPKGKKGKKSKTGAVGAEDEDANSDEEEHLLDDDEELSRPKHPWWKCWG